MTNDVPVITLDGVSGSGKGTISLLLAEKLGWHYLDSGALYRILANQVIKHQATFEDVAAIVQIANAINIEFKRVKTDGQLGIQVHCNGEDISLEIRTEDCGKAASMISSYPEVRKALVERQQAFRQSPGLVTDGRDMGSVIFPDASLKFYFDASIEERAKRRFLQLQAKGFDVKLASLHEELEKRDARDKGRSISPLVVPDEAVYVLTDDMTIDEVFNLVMKHVSAAGLTEKE